MKNLNLKIFLLFIAIVLTNNAIARIKCWTNNEGNRECGDKIPPEYTQQGYKELDKSGLVREEKEKVKTKLKKSLFTNSEANPAAAKPRITSRKVATKLCKVFFITSLIVFFANLHPTEAPRINKQKFIVSFGNL